MDARVVTVNGPVDPVQLGLALPHEHIMVDFVGADKVSKHRYRPDDVITTIVLLPKNWTRNRYSLVNALWSGWPS